MKNKVPDGFETDDRLDVSLRPDEVCSVTTETCSIVKTLAKIVCLSAFMRLFLKYKQQICSCDRLRIRKLVSFAIR